MSSDAKARRRAKGHGLAVWWATLALANLLVACQTTAPEVSSLPTPILPTPEATQVPGSDADARNAVEVVQSFEEALRERNELVALLLLTPHAQNRVAASDLAEFVPADWRNDATSGCRATLDQDTATVSCERSSQGSPPWLRVSLLRLNGAWKIDGVESVGSP